MVEVFNSLNVQVSCLGNHDLDFGIAKMQELTAKTTSCKWIMSNLNVEGRPVGNLETFVTKEISLAGCKKREKRKSKVGFFGLASEDWPGLMMMDVKEELQYTDFVEKGRVMTAMLKSAPHNCDLIVALTHMRCPDDRILAKSVPGIDLILGGHDHSYVTEIEPTTGVFLIKSGTDFEEFNNLDLLLEANESDYALGA